MESDKAVSFSVHEKVGRISGIGAKQRTEGIGREGKMAAVGQHKLSVRSRLMLVGSFVGMFFFFALWFKEANVLQWGSEKLWLARQKQTGSEVAVEMTRNRALPQEIALALVHYAKETVVPQQSREEIMITEAVLAARAPCNFLVFGLGFDSLLWKSLNHGGRTVFLEETESWLLEMQGKHPGLEAYHMKYSTQLQFNAEYLEHSRVERQTICSAGQDIRTSKCKLAIANLPSDLYEVEWDVIMIDAPRGYFPEAPGRMGAIFTMAVLARNRASTTRGNYTDIMLHDIDRPVEKTYALEFLCTENRVAAVHRLWHFQIYPSKSRAFCA